MPQRPTRGLCVTTMRWSRPHRCCSMLLPLLVMGTCQAIPRRSPLLPGVLSHSLRSPSLSTARERNHVHHCRPMDLHHLRLSTFLCSNRPQHYLPLLMPPSTHPLSIPNCRRGWLPPELPSLDRPAYVATPPRALSQPSKTTSECVLASRCFPTTPSPPMRLRLARTASSGEASVFLGTMAFLLKFDFIQGVFCRAYDSYE